MGIIVNFFRSLRRDTDSTPQVSSSQMSGATEGATPIPVAVFGAPDAPTKPKLESTKQEPPKPEAPKPAWDAAIAFVLAEEGGYVDHPRDPGRCTNYGVTLATLRRWRNSETVDCAAVRAMLPLEAREIMRANYWNAVRGDDLPRGIGLCVFDFAVNAGPRAAGIKLQQVLGMTKVDGVIGPATCRMVWGSQDFRRIVMRYCDARMEFYRSLPTWNTFGKGWTARTERCRAEALAMVARRY